MTNNFGISGYDTTPYIKKGDAAADKLTVDGEANLIETLKKSGMQVISPADLTPFRARAKKAAKELEKDWGEGLIEKVQSVN